MMRCFQETPSGDYSTIFHPAPIVTAIIDDWRFAAIDDPHVRWQAARSIWQALGSSYASSTTSTPEPTPTQAEPEPPPTPTRSPDPPPAPTGHACKKWIECQDHDCEDGQWPGCAGAGTCMCMGPLDPALAHLAKPAPGIRSFCNNYEDCWRFHCPHGGKFPICQHGAAGDPFSSLCVCSH
ncbi:hypothetical protein CDD82_1675 [Ophiocordyceps australis]|uniref:Uncharacterized protein n=1 Tax=Ophiocordyceps australis TaxID=1399860 RepID=A0A2C5YDK1_9HYPO|nr:hypothetical protein CDD82_1675 [Ophiocordyceps australis]